VAISLKAFVPTCSNNSVSMLASYRITSRFRRKAPYVGKLVRVIQGKVLDVAVDIRKGSATYGQAFSIELSGENQLQFWIPEGFAHGFSTLEDQTIFAYKCTNYYHKASEGGIRYDDPSLNIDWKISAEIVSPKDLELPFLADLNSPF
jgi:dTDP-4-dehydrorhamnose 3,5-epimerase